MAGSGTARLLAGFPGAGGLGGGACALEYRGFLHAFVQIARCEGLPGLYKGLLPSLLLVSCCWLRPSPPLPAGMPRDACNSREQQQQPAWFLCDALPVQL